MAKSPIISSKHSKYKNTIFLFEILNKLLTSAKIVELSTPNFIIAESSTVYVLKNKIKTILETKFKKDSILLKELSLYNLLINPPFDKIDLSTEEKINKFIDTVIGSRTTLDKLELSKLKYNLVKEIKTLSESAFSIKLDNYTLYASIYNLFNLSELAKEYTAETLSENKIYISPIANVQYREYIVNHIKTKYDKYANKNSLLEPNNKTNEFSETAINEFLSQPPVIRQLVIKQLFKRFNESYNGLNPKIKSLLKNYLLWDLNSEEFKKYFYTEVKNSIGKLEDLLLELYKDDIDLFENKNEQIIIKNKLSELIKQAKTNLNTKTLTEWNITGLYKLLNISSAIISTNSKLSLIL